MFLKRDSQSWPQNIRIISICVPIFLLLCLSIILAILGRRLYARRSFSRLNTIQVPNVYVENPYAPGLGGSAYLQRTDTYASQSNINDPESYLQNQPQYPAPTHDRHSPTPAYQTLSNAPLLAVQGDSKTPRASMDGPPGYWDDTNGQGRV